MNTDDLHKDLHKPLNNQQFKSRIVEIDKSKSTAEEKLLQQVMASLSNFNYNNQEKQQ